MTLFRSALIGIAILSLAACATAAQKTNNEMDSSLKEIADSFMKCSEPVIKAAPDYEAIFEIENGRFTSRAVENKNYIQESKKASLQDTIDKLRACRDDNIFKIQYHNNEYVRSFTQLAIEEQRLKGDIHHKYLSGEITGGQAVISFENIVNSLRNKWSNQYQDCVNHLNQQHFQQQQAQAAMWQTIGAGFQNYSNQQKQLYQQQQANKPVQTQCRWIGEVMNCTSY